MNTKVSVEMSPAFVHYELKGISCGEIFRKQPNIELRFDLKYGNEDENFGKWRGVVKKNVEGDPILEIKNYADTEHKIYILDNFDTLSDASLMALNQTWTWIRENAEKYPPTKSMPII